MNLAVHASSEDDELEIVELEEEEEEELEEETDDEESNESETEVDTFCFFEAPFIEVGADDFEIDEESPDRQELMRVLTNVSHRLRKSSPIEWVDAVIFKLEECGINSVALLHVHLPHINRRLAHAGESTFHRVTIRGIREEVARAIAGDHTNVPIFRQAHA